jgi:ligand-binding sensor domain-containing protein
MTGWEVKSVVETPDGSFWLATEDGVTRIPGDAPELNGGAAP